MEQEGTGVKGPGATPLSLDCCNQDLGKLLNFCVPQFPLSVKWG